MKKRVVLSLEEDYFLRFIQLKISRYEQFYQCWESMTSVLKIGKGRAWPYKVLIFQCQYRAILSPSPFCCPRIKFVNLSDGIYLRVNILLSSEDRGKIPFVYRRQFSIRCHKLRKQLFSFGSVRPFSVLQSVLLG